MNRVNDHYRKFCYWLDQEELKAVEEDLRTGHPSLAEETHIPCRGLRASSEVTLIHPSAWDGLCRRRTSWYWAWEEAGKVLIVSNHRLKTPRLQPRLFVTHSDFRPDCFPDASEMTRMARSDAFRKRVPAPWERVEPVEKDFYRRWFKRYGIHEPFDFDEVFVIHSANHANFIDPRFFVTLGDTRAPYSIADSLHTCSSCLEFFGILGGQWPMRYVVPCLGAVHFARLPRDHYFQIASTGGTVSRGVAYDS